MSDKELKEYKDNLIKSDMNYYDVIDCVIAGKRENRELQDKIHLLNDMNDNIYNKYCNLLKLIAEFEIWVVDSKHVISSQDVLEKMKELKGKYV